MEHVLKYSGIMSQKHTSLDLKNLTTAGLTDLGHDSHSSTFQLALSFDYQSSAEKSTGDY